MSTLHPHWQATDEGEAVPVRIAQPTCMPAGAKTVSRRPAAIVGILLTLSAGAVAYGTFDDGEAQMTGELMGVENPTTYFDVLAEQMVRSSIHQQMDAAPESMEAPVEDAIVYREELESSIPVNPSTWDTAPAALPVSLPTNQNTIGANVTESFHSGAPRPVEQPQTGAGMLWATILGAAAMLFWQSLGMLKARAE